MPKGEVSRIPPGSVSYLFLYVDYYALKDGYAKDVAQEIVRHEPTISLTDAESSAKYYLSKMFREHKIAVIRKDGKKYKYGIKPEGT